MKRFPLFLLAVSLAMPSFSVDNPVSTSPLPMILMMPPAILGQPMSPPTPARPPAAGQSASNAQLSALQAEIDALPNFEDKATLTEQASLQDGPSAPGAGMSSMIGTAPLNSPNPVDDPTLRGLQDRLKLEKNTLYQLHTRYNEVVVRRINLLEKYRDEVFEARDWLRDGNIGAVQFLMTRIRMLAANIAACDAEMIAIMRDVDAAVSRVTQTQREIDDYLESRQP